MKWMDSLLALTLSSTLSTNTQMGFLNWGGRLEHFSVTEKYTEYSGYVFFEGSRDRALLSGSGSPKMFLFVSSPGSFSGECQPSEVNSACSESKTFAEVALQTVQINSTWQKGARENL